MKSKSLNLSPLTKLTDIVVGQDYLCKIDNRFVVGSFSKQHYGLCLDDGVMFYQLDQRDEPNWQGIWELPTKGSGMNRLMSSILKDALKDAS